MYPATAIGFFRISTGGAGFNAGSGLYKLDLPVSVHTEFLTLNTAVPVGKAYLHDNDAVLTSTNLVVLFEVATGLLVFRRHDGDFWRNNAPFTLAQNDRVAGYFMLPVVNV